MYFEAKGSDHNEAAFAKRAEPMLKYLFAQHANSGSGGIPHLNSLNVIGTEGFATAIMTGTVLHSDDPEFPKRPDAIHIRTVNETIASFGTASLFNRLRNNS